MKTNVPVAAVVHAEMAEAIIATTGISYDDPKAIESFTFSSRDGNSRSS